MFSLGTWGEILIIAVVAVIVISPKDLPYALKKVGRWVAQLRRWQSDLQGHFDTIVNESERIDTKENIGANQNDKRHK